MYSVGVSARGVVVAAAIEDQEEIGSLDDEGEPGADIDGMDRESQARGVWNGPRRGLVCVDDLGP